VADKKASLIIQLKDGVSDGLKKIGDQADGLKSKFANFKLVLAGVAAGMAALGAAAWSAIKSYMESENAVNRLNVALKNQCQDVSKTSKELQAYAAELQKTTTFSDEAILSAMSLMTSFGLTGNQLKSATKAALDLSQGLGIDLQSASMLLSKAFQGQTEALGRYGIKVDQHIPKSMQFASIMDQVNSRFGGSAQAAVDTTSGKIQNLTNRIDDLKEKIGAQLIPVLDFWMKKFEGVLGYIEKLAGAEENEARGRQLTIDTMKAESEEIIRQAQLRAAATGNVVMLTEKERMRLDLLTESIARERDMLTLEQQNMTTKQTNSALGLSLLQSELLAQEEMETAARNKKTAAEVKDSFDRQARWAAEKAAWDKQLIGISKATTTHQTTMKKAEDTFNKEKMAGVESTFNYISALSTVKNKQLAAIGKAAAISETIINTIRAAQGAYAALAPIPIVGPALGAAAAALATTAGMARVAQIKGIPMAEGGVVLPRTGGTVATIGEAGKAEAVIPLDDDRAKQAMGGLGGVTINVHAGTLIADRMSVHEFAKRIDEELFRLERNRFSVR
jgi:hypothetical protein